MNPTEFFDIASFESKDFIIASFFFEIPYELIIAAAIVEFFQW